MHFIQHKQVSETNVTSHAFQQISDFSWMQPPDTENAMPGHMRPACLSLDDTVLDHQCAEYKLW